MKGQLQVKESPCQIGVGTLSARQSQISRQKSVVHVTRFKLSDTSTLPNRPPTGPGRFLNEMTMKAIVVNNFVEVHHPKPQYSNYYYPPH